MITVPYSEVNKFPELFQDYCSGVNDIESLFARSFRDVNWKQIYDTSQIPVRSLHSDFLEILRLQNKSMGASGHSMELIDKLADPRAAVVVTGQQTGLFGGPLFTMYKAVTLIRLAQEIERKIGSPVVPIFWMETTDHDFEEVRRVGISNQLGEARDYIYAPDNVTAKQPVGHIVLDENIQNLLTAVNDALPDTEFKTDIMNLLQSQYVTGDRFSKAFGGLMHALLSPLPCLFLDSGEAMMRSYSAKFHVQLFTRLNQILQAIRKQSETIQSMNYPLQVPVSEEQTFMYELHDEKRQRISKLENGMYRIADRKTTEKDLLKNLQGNKIQYDCGVLFRPLIQELMLPNIAYIAGPSEICYWAQLRKAFEVLNIPMPVVYPRISVTIIEKRIQQLMDKLAIDVREVLKSKREIRTRIISDLKEKELNDQIDVKESRILQDLQEYIQLVGDIDPTLGASAEKVKSKVEYQLQKLKNKSINALEKKYQVHVQQYYKIQESIYPLGQLQERKLNILSYLNRYGFTILEKIKKLNIDATDTHTLLDL